MKYLLFLLVLLLPALLSSAGHNDNAMDGPNRNMVRGGSQQTTTAIHPEVERNITIPGWTRTTAASIMYSDFRVLMGIGIYVDTSSPFIRLWKNIPEEDHAVCPRCTSDYNYYIPERNEIWLRDGATVNDMMDEIVKFFQVTQRGIPPGMLGSPFARGERKFFIDIVIKNPPHLKWGAM